MPPFLSFYYLCHINPLKIMELLSYFYHPDHTSTRLSTGLGSSSWITDNIGRPIQHLHYLPFGEDWVDQRNSSWNAPYTFSGKEKDVETGYNFFGARYYDSGLSVWLSVDPLSDKYPTLSPYTYCTNNPIMMVDPDGRRVTIAGEAKRAFFRELRHGAKEFGIKIKMDRKGNLTAKYIGEGPISTEGQQIMDAIERQDLTIEIYATKSDYAKGKPFFGGAFMGTEVNTKEDGTLDVIAKQIVNPNDLSALDKYNGKRGRSSVHEMTEAFQAALISLTTGNPVNTGMNSNDYRDCNAAAIQPSGGIKYFFMDSNGNYLGKNSNASEVHSVGYAFPNADFFVKTVQIKK